mgnify:CR=1 FL=1
MNLFVFQSISIQFKRWHALHRHKFLFPTATIGKFAKKMKIFLLKFSLERWIRRIFSSHSLLYRQLFRSNVRKRLSTAHSHDPSFTGHGTQFLNKKRTPQKSAVLGPMVGRQFRAGRTLFAPSFDFIFLLLTALFRTETRGG